MIALGSKKLRRKSFACAISIKTEDLEGECNARLPLCLRERFQNSTLDRLGFAQHISAEARGNFSVLLSGLEVESATEEMG